MLETALNVNYLTRALKIPCSKLQGIFPVRNLNRSIIRSLTPQQAAGNALAIAVHIFWTF
jgi:hypothetical protein